MSEVNLRSMLDEIRKKIVSWRSIEIDDLVLEKVRINVNIPNLKELKITSTTIGLRESLEIIEESYEWLSRNIDKIIRRAKKMNEFNNVLELVLGLLNTTLITRKWINAAKKADEALKEIESTVNTIKLLGADWTQIDMMRKIGNRILLALEKVNDPEEFLRIVERNLMEAREISEKIRGVLEEKPKSKIGEVLRRIEEAKAKGRNEVTVQDLTNKEIARILESINNIKLNPLRKVLLIGEKND